MKNLHIHKRIIRKVLQRFNPDSIKWINRNEILFISYWSACVFFRKLFSSISIFRHIFIFHRPWIVFPTTSFYDITLTQITDKYLFFFLKCKSFDWITISILNGYWINVTTSKTIISIVIRNNCFSFAIGMTNQNAQQIFGRAKCNIRIFRKKFNNNTK